MAELNVLFFIAGPVPTEAERAAAEKLSGRVAFRNIQHVGDSDGARENVAFVAGDVIPALYAEVPVAKPLKTTPAHKAAQEGWTAKE
jgi:hypothetical protein